MRLLRKIVLWTLLLGSVFLTSAFVFVAVNGKTMARNYFERATGRTIAIEGVRYLFPLGMDLRDVTVPELLTAGSVRIQVALPLVRDRKLEIRSVSIQDAQIRIIRKDKENGDGPNAEPFIGTSAAADRSSSALTGVLFKRVTIEDGEVLYVDSPSGKKRTVLVKSLSLQGQDLLYPWAPGRMRFRLAAVFLAEGFPVPAGRIKGSGWIDIASRDMEAEFEAQESGGGVFLKSQVKSENNDLAVKGSVTFDAKPTSDEPDLVSGQESFQKTVRDLFQAVGLQVMAEYEFKTKMDDIRIDKIGLTGQVEIPDIMGNQSLVEGTASSGGGLDGFSAQHPFKQLLAE